MEIEMTTYTQQDVDFLVATERGANSIKAFALGLFMFFGGVAAGFLLAYGIAYWGW